MGYELYRPLVFNRSAYMTIFASARSEISFYWQFEFSTNALIFKFGNPRQFHQIAKLKTLQSFLLYQWLNSYRMRVVKGS